MFKIRWRTHIKNGWSHFKLYINDWDIPFPKILRIYQWIGKSIFHWGKWNEPLVNSVHTAESLLKRLWKYIFLAYVCKSVALSAWTQETQLLYCFSFRVHHYFRFLRNLSIALILDERYICCLMKFKNNSPYKYIAYSLASYFLGLIRLGI